MGGSRKCLLAAVAAWVCLLMTPPASAQQGVEITRKIGVLAHRGDEAAVGRWASTIDAVDAELGGVRLELLPLSLDGVRAALMRGEIDYLFTNPGHFQRLSERFGLAPMVGLRTDRSDKPATGNRFGAVVFVRADNSAVTTLADLEGRKLAAVAPDAFGGFEVAAATLLRNGVDPWRDLGSIAFLGFPQDAIIEAVVAGKADAGTVRTGMIEAAVNSGLIEPDAVRVLNPLRVRGFDLALSTELVPEWLISATADVPEAERRAFAVTLLQMEESDPAVRAGGYGGWTTVPSEAPVRRLLTIIDEAKAGSSRQLTGFAGTGLGLTAFSALLLAGMALWRRSRRPRQATHAPGRARHADVRLTPRENEILGMVANGLTTKEIARELGISPKTVEFHRSHLMRKFEAHNMAELVRNAGEALAPRPV